MADLEPMEAPLSNGAAVPPETETLAPPPPAGSGGKRQRRPSVRLGEIGGQPAATPQDPFARRSKQWRAPSHSQRTWPAAPAGGGGGGGEMGRIPSRTRPLTNLISEDFHVASDLPAVSGEENRESAPAVLRGGGGGGGKEGRSKKGSGVSSRRHRANWMPEMDDGQDPAAAKPGGGDAGEEGYRDYDDLQREDWEIPTKDHSILLSDRRPARSRILENREAGLPSAIEAPDMEMTLETDAREWHRAQISSPAEDGGVRVWLNGLGLGRYGPVFEIHEVDDEVLPLLTLDDLKDMGINAVGSRRKMYCAIQKLRRNLS
ncbi:unnamed protein product [Spirodela intermedia]|uniref:SAM domain-containing protein n=1 Tax=Spirodela intermedia TaxID=51605 RepID=A0A7I8L577_SPIIN|nr:unnamed protein product [Spirodela intermedia]